MVVDPDTPYEKIKVMDFGLAKLIEHGNGIGMMHHQSNTGIDFAVGTPGYISPEQVRGEETDYRCDIYGVGVMLFELLTGRLPFIRDETMDVLFAHATEPPPSFADVGAANWAPPEIEAIVMRSLAKSPDDRPASARELAEAYQKALRSVEQQMGPQPDAVVATPTPVEPADAVKQTMITPITAPPYDANVIVHHLEAWMPDVIATNKLRGFVQDNNGEVLESVQGKIKVRIGGVTKKGAFSWLGINRRGSIIDVELRLDRNNPAQQNQLHITVLMSSPNTKPADACLRERCSEVFCELRSYLAATVVVN
jgi:eukaryotic-like serine/threonine-protein kinase